MTKKISRKEFIESLQAKSNRLSEKDFGDLFGVKKQSVGYWKKEDGQIPFDRFLSMFGPETLEWIKQEYGLDSGESEARYIEIGKAAERLFLLLSNKKAPEGGSEA